MAKKALTKQLTSDAQGLVTMFRRDLRMTPLDQLPKALTGKLLWFFHDVLGRPLEECWALIRPDSTSTGASARVQASRYLQHYKRKNPAGIADALMAAGITIQNITDMARDMLFAKKWCWNPKTEAHEPTDAPDWPARDRAIGRFIEIAKLDHKVRDEVALGRADAQKTQIITGPKFETIKEWQEWVEGEDEKLRAERALAAREMKLIAAGRRIIQEVGEKEAEKMRQTALAAGLTGDESDDE